MIGSMYEIVGDDGCIITAYERKQCWSITIENHEKYNGDKTFLNLEDAEKYVKTIIQVPQNTELPWEDLTPPIKPITL